MPTRRQFLAGSASIATLPLLGRADPLRAGGQHMLTAKQGTANLLGEGEPATPIWGYNGSVPGPILRTSQGQPFALDLLNQLPQPTTIHWHGIRIDNAMDGVANMTQQPVKPGETFAYRFTPPDAGTYWYHPHYRTWEQLARGLQGAFIVTEENPPAVDQDVVLIVDDWRLDKAGSIDERSLGSMFDIAHAGRRGNVLTLNGKDTFDVPVKAGERLRLRLINTANARIVGVILEDHAPIVVALDGQPVATPFAPKRNMIFLTPAQRADIILDCNQPPGAKTQITVDTGREKLRLGQLSYHPSKRAREKVLADIPILPPNPMPTDLDLDNAIDVALVMTGGARSAFRSAQYKGREMNVRELVREHRKAWAFNDIVGMPQKPLAQIPIGKTVRVKLVNKTFWAHAMHFHGHHVREISHSARAPQPYWRDTIFMDRDQEITVAFKAHNPGKWMLHCHMLAHQSGGMATWYEVG